MCEHERLRTVGDTVYCVACGVALPLEFLMEKGKPAEPEQKPDTEPEQTPENTPENTPDPEQKPEQEPEQTQEPIQGEQNEAENPAPAAKAGKSTTKGTGGKKAAKTPKKG